MGWEKIIKLKGSKLISNIWNQFILYGFSHILPFILMPFLLSTIGIDKYGLINFAIAFSFYFQVVCEWGFDLSNVRHVVENRNNINHLSYVVCSILSCKILLLLLCLVIYCSLVLLVPSLYEDRGLYFWAFIRLFGIILTPFWLFRSLENVKFVTRISLIVKVICILPIFILVHNANDYVWVMICFSAETVCSAIIAVIIARKNYKLVLCNISFNDIAFFIKDSLPFFSSTFLSRLYQNSNTFILGTFCGNATTGIYTAAEKLHNAYASLILPILVQIFYPYFQRIKDFVRINKMVMIIIFVNLIGIIILYILSPYIFPLFVSESVDVLLFYFRLFLLVLVFSIPNELIGFPYLGVMGFANKVNMSTIIASCIYIVFVIGLVIAAKITIINLIVTLIITNLCCFTIRVYYIRKNKSCLVQN